MMVVKVTPSDSGREGGSQVRLARPGELRHQGPSLSQTRCCPGIFGGHLSPPEQMAHPDNITCYPQSPVPRAGEGPHRGHPHPGRASTLPPDPALQRRATWWHRRTRVEWGCAPGLGRVS